MDQCGHFAENPEAIRKVNNENLTEFSEEPDIPKSTLQDILKYGSPHTSHRSPHRRTSEPPAEHLDRRDGYAENMDALLSSSVRRI